MFLDVLMQGIGLSLEEALIFWRSEFTKLMDVDKVPVFLTPKWQWVILDLEVTNMIHEIKNVQ